MAFMLGTPVKLTPETVSKFYRGGRGEGAWTPYFSIPLFILKGPPEPSRIMSAAFCVHVLHAAPV